MDIRFYSKKHLKKNIPQIRPGDIVKVHYKIKEGAKERIQVFEGIVIARHGGEGLDATFTVRRVSMGVGVERIFPLHSPSIAKIEKVKSIQVRRAKLYYLRDLVGKRAKKHKELKEFAVWEEPEVEEELKRVEAAKVAEAATKASAKAEEEAGLEKKFAAAQASRQEK